jgi:hypothetical protein
MDRWRKWWTSFWNTYDSLYRRRRAEVTGSLSWIYMWNASAGIHWLTRTTTMGSVQSHTPKNESAREDYTVRNGACNHFLPNPVSAVSKLVEDPYNGTHQSHAYRNCANCGRHYNYHGNNWHRLRITPLRWKLVVAPQERVLPRYTSNELLRKKKWTTCSSDKAIVFVVILLPVYTLASNSRQNQCWVESPRNLVKPPFDAPIFGVWRRHVIS